MVDTKQLKKLIKRLREFLDDLAPAYEEKISLNRRKIDSIEARSKIAEGRSKSESRAIFKDIKDQISRNSRSNITVKQYVDEIREKFGTDLRRAVINRGDWDSTKSYQLSNLIFHQGSFYIALKTEGNVNKNPHDTTYWCTLGRSTNILSSGGGGGGPTKNNAGCGIEIVGEECGCEPNTINVCISEEPGNCLEFKTDAEEKKCLYVPIKIRVDKCDRVEVNCEGVMEAGTGTFKNRYFSQIINCDTDEVLENVNRGDCLPYTVVGTIVDCPTLMFTTTYQDLECNYFYVTNWSDGTITTVSAIDPMVQGCCILPEWFVPKLPARCAPSTGTITTLPATVVKGFSKYEFCLSVTGDCSGAGNDLCVIDLDTLEIEGVQEGCAVCVTNVGPNDLCIRVTKCGKVCEFLLSECGVAEFTKQCEEWTVSALANPSSLYEVESCVDA